MKKMIFRLVPVFCALLVLAGCSGGGGGTGNTGPSVSQVETAELSETFTTADFAPAGSGVATYDAAAADAFTSLGMMLTTVFGTGADYLAGLDETEFSDWMDNFATTTLVPSDLDTLSGIPEYVHIVGSVISDAAFGLQAVIASGAEVDVTVDIDTTNERPTHISFSVELTDAVVDVTGSIPSSEDYDAFVNGGRVAVSANLNVDLYITWTYDSGMDDYYPTVFNGAYSISFRGQAALSGGSGDPSTGGNILASIEMDDSATLYIDESLMADAAALQNYLDTKIQPDHFSVTIAVYNDADGQELSETTLTLDDLLALIPTA
jgi:hypothetical protein